ncbi:ABC transporter substrate-binding protein [Pseudomonas sp. LS1212]|uniref:cytochrome c/ABC transporter substrate-binding protein n=1 Tax=Pseudomonas sp. LS1212 TaxID=2972478 RepID=UPI00215D11C5|nr:ABC transporter substrate-binding protein [Pseudomonas sp. LS1212]UVJ46113.1 ABC transporter substrate-binding protein [Pseudomonas sp. LS1212]
MKPIALWMTGLLALSGLAHGLQLSDSEAAGKRLYREGLSALAVELSARVGASDMLVPAQAVPCANCHGADGRGRPEGGVRPPDITWRRLSTPYGQSVNGRQYPAYTEAAIARAVAEGRDPAGNRLDPAMPRFVLTLRDQANLTAYLKRLEDDSDPGLQARHLRLGTLLPRQGPQAELGNTVASVLNASIEQINQAGGIHGRSLELVSVDPGADKESARAALNTLINGEQVFALIAPLAPALDEEMAGLLEQAQVPLVGSLSLFGVSQNSRQIFEPLPGLREQVLALARYAAGALQLATTDTVIVHPADDTQSALADNLAERLRGQGWTRVREVAYSADSLQALQGAQAVFYLGQASEFATLAGQLERAGLNPYLFAASTQVASQVLQVPLAFSERLFLAFPFVPQDWTAAGRAALTELRQRSGLGGQHAVLQVGAYCSVLLLSEGLKRAGRDVSRQRLIDALESLHDFDTGLTPQLNFGPGKRLGLSGGHIVRVELPEQRFDSMGAFIEVP